MLSKIKVTPSPHISKRMSTRSVMLDVVLGLAPAMLAAVVYFRIRALILIVACVVAAEVAEWLCNVIRRAPKPAKSLEDLSAVVTGIILALSLPPGIPVGIAVIGSAFSVVIGKMVFGGLGANVFNPAMVGRAFLTVSFGVLMTTWTVPATIDGAMPTISLTNEVDTRTQATPLAWSKTAIKAKADAPVYSDNQFFSTVIGNVGGCLGETSTLAVVLGGIILLWRRTIGFHIPVAVIASAFAFSGIAYLINSDAYVQPFFHLTSGALLFGAFFIATDPVTAPLTRRGMWLFGIGVGALTMLIRIVGEYPEGMMFAVLLMNGVTPLIDRLFKRIPAGGMPRG
jgi:electron transport complex protein RnfD